VHLDGHPPRGRRRRVGGPRPVGALTIGTALVVLLAVSGALASASFRQAAARQHSRTGGRPASAAGAGRDFRVTDSGRDYTPASLPHAAAALMALQAAGDAGGRAPTGPLARLETQTGLARCLRVLGTPADAVDAVDLGRFRGRPAAVFMLGMPGNAAKVMFFVEGPACASGRDATLYWASTPRPAS
jgi:hypothetical protein